MLSRLFRSRAPEPPSEPPGSPEAIALAPDEFRNAFARLASSVAVVTFDIGRHLHGFTATSFTPVSLVPPMALFCVGRNNESHRHLAIGTQVGISILSIDQTDISARFAAKTDLGGYADIATFESVTGARLAEGAVAGFQGTVSELIPAGDHTIYLCRLAFGMLARMAARCSTFRAITTVSVRSYGVRDNKQRRAARAIYDGDC